MHKLSPKPLPFCVGGGLVHWGVLSSFPDLDSHASNYRELVLGL